MATPSRRCEKCNSTDVYGVINRFVVRCNACGHETPERRARGHDFGFEDKTFFTRRMPLNEDSLATQLFELLRGKVERDSGLSDLYTANFNVKGDIPRQDMRNPAEKRIAELEEQLRVAQMSEEMARAQNAIDKTENLRLRQRANALELRCTIAENAAMRAQSAPAGLSPEMTRRLIQLCHPDKHANSEASQKATQFLLGEKRG